MSSTHMNADVTWTVYPGGRRSPWRWLSDLGLGLLSFFSQVNDAKSSSGPTSGAGAAEAAEPCNTTGFCTPVRCCCLACADVECPYEGNPADFTCPPGSFKTYWTCVEGSQVVACGECAGADDCRAAPFYCSIAFDL